MNFDLCEGLRSIKSSTSAKHLVTFIEVGVATSRGTGSSLACRTKFLHQEFQKLTILEQSLGEKKRSRILPTDRGKYRKKTAQKKENCELKAVFCAFILKKMLIFNLCCFLKAQRRLFSERRQRRLPAATTKVFQLPCLEVSRGRG